MLNININDVNINYKQNGFITQTFKLNDTNYIYQGTVNKDNEMHGYGKLWTNNYSYHGYFKNNTLSDEGILTYTGSYNNISDIKYFVIYYKGFFLNNKKHGKGIEKYLNNEYYQGDFFNNLKHGEGSLYNHNGQVKIKGYWDLGKKIDTKHITQYYQNGVLKYKGDYNGTSMHGKGTYCNINGMIIFEGEFYNGNFTNGKLYNNNLICFEGEFIDNIPFKGTFYWNNAIKFGIASVEIINNEKYLIGKTTIYKPTGDILFKGNLINTNKSDTITNCYSLVCDDITINYKYNYDIQLCCSIT